jgi:hypothetical protein
MANGYTLEEKLAAWRRHQKRYPSLRSFHDPYDPSGKLKPAALAAYYSATRKQPPVTAAPARTQPPVTAAPPAPVDWGQRGADIAKGLASAAQFISPLGMAKRFIDTPLSAPSDTPEAGGGFSGFLKKGVDYATRFTAPEMKALETYQEAIKPLPSLAFEKIPGLREEGVQERARQLREQGHGPLASVQAAYEQSLEAGEIPWWKRYPAEMLLDPIEAIPGVGIGGAITKGVMTGARAATRGAAKGALGRAAPAVTPKVPAPAVKQADVVPVPTTARAAAPDVAEGLPRRQINQLVENVVETSPNKGGDAAKYNARIKVNEKFKDLLSADSEKRLQGTDRKNAVNYIARQTKSEPDEINSLIDKALGQKKLAIKDNALLKVAEDWNDKYWGLKGLQTGFGFVRRLTPGKLAKGEVNVSEAVDLLPGIPKASLVKTEEVYRNMRDIAPLSRDNGSFETDVGDFLFAKHGKEVFKEKPDRKWYGTYKSAKELDALDNDLRARMAGISPKGNQSLAYQQVEKAAGLMQKEYRDMLEEAVSEGFVTRKVRDDLTKAYPWYHPLRYDEQVIGGKKGDVEDYDPHIKILKPRDKSGKARKAQNMLKRLDEEGDEENMISPMKALRNFRLRHDRMIASNRIKRTVIQLGLEENLEGLSKAIGTKARVKGKDVFTTKPPEGPNVVEYFDPRSPGERQYFNVPEFVAREIDFMDVLPSSQGAMKLLRNFTTIKRRMLTTYNPVFIMANLLNDMFAVAVSRRVNPYEVFREMPGIKRGDDPFTRAYTLAGGGQERFFGESVESILKRELGKYYNVLDGKPRADIADSIRSTGGNPVNKEEALSMIDKALGPLRWTGGKIERAGQIGETAPRIAAGKKKLTELMPDWKERLRSGDLTVEDLAKTPEMRTATVDGLNATINFSRGGRQVQLLNRYVLFLNAAMEGMKLPLRAGQSQGWRRLGGTLAALGTGQVVLTAYNMQYPEYFDIPVGERYGSVFIMLPSREKDDYGNPRPFRINIVPRTRELSVFFGTATYMLEKMFKDNPQGYKDFAYTLLPQATPLGVHHDVPGGLLPPFPEVAEIGLEIWGDEDLYRERPIVPEHLQKADFSEQVAPWTSPTLRALAGSLDEMGWSNKWLASPLRVQHLFNQLLPGVGREALTAADLLYDVMIEDTDPKIRALANEYAQLKSTRERAAFFRDKEAEPEVRKEVISEARATPSGAIEQALRIPVVGGIARRISPPTRGELQRTKRGIAAEQAGVDEEETRKAGIDLAGVSDRRLTAQQDADKTVDLDAPYTDVHANSDRQVWREVHKKKGLEISAIYQNKKEDYPKAVQFADQETQRIYYETLATAGGALPDIRDRGQQLLAGWYSIMPSDAGLSDDDRALGMLDFDLFFDQRRQYREGLSEEDRRALDEELSARRTTVEKRYYADLDYIQDAGFFEIMPSLVNHFGLTSQWDEYRSKRGRARTDFLNDPRSRAPGMKGGLREVLAYSRVVKDKMRNADEGLEQRLLYWGFFQKPIKEISLRQVIRRAR